jgi:hypothetical protein
MYCDWTAEMPSLADHIQILALFVDEVEISAVSAPFNSMLAFSADYFCMFHPPLIRMNVSTDSTW